MTETQIARMEARAMEQRWPTKPEYRDALIKRNMNIILNPKSTERAVAAASRVILAAEQQNQLDEHKVIDVRVVTRNDQYDAIAAELGIAPDLIEHAARQADILAGRTEENATANSERR
jgi:hypothetical protein